jgi:hypothetical protein
MSFFKRNKKSLKEVKYVVDSGDELKKIVEKVDKVAYLETNLHNLYVKNEQEKKKLKSKIMELTNLNKNLMIKIENTKNQLSQI